MNQLDVQYQNLVRDILENGVEKRDRTGVGTKSVFGRTIRHRMSDGFPLLTTKKMYWKGIVAELLWFLRGQTNIKFLLDLDCHIWDGDAYSKYRKSNSSEVSLTKEEFIEKIKTDEDFANKWGELGPIYGKQWRSWPHTNYWYNGSRPMVETSHIDQLQNLIFDLKNNPDSRRMMVNAWHVDQIDEMALPPCHYGFQVYTRELSVEERIKWCTENVENLDDYVKSHVSPESIQDLNHPAYSNEIINSLADSLSAPKRAISLMWQQRSVDTPLGLPFNIASYGLLLEIIARIVNMVPEELIGNLGDTHVYLNQVDSIKDQLDRVPYNLPTISISGIDTSKTLDEIINGFRLEDFKLNDYQSHSSIKIQLSN